MTTIFKALKNKPLPARAGLSSFEVTGLGRRWGWVKVGAIIYIHKNGSRTKNTLRSGNSLSGLMFIYVLTPPTH